MAGKSTKKGKKKQSVSDSSIPEQAEPTQEVKDEGETEPDSKVMPSQGQVTVLPEPSNDAHVVGILQALNGNIASVNENILQVKNDILEVKKDQKQDFESLNLRITDILSDMCTLKSNVNGLSETICIVEKQCNDSHTWLTNRINEIQSSFDLLNLNASKLSSQLICKGIPKSESENLEDLKGYVHRMLYDNLKLDINTVKVQDIEQIMHPDGNIGPAVITLDCSTSQEIVLASKRELRNIDGYKKVFIEKRLSKQELKFDRSLRNIAKTFSDLKYVGGVIRPTRVS